MAPEENDDLGFENVFTQAAQAAATGQDSPPPAPTTPAAPLTPPVSAPPAAAAPPHSAPTPAPPDKPAAGVTPPGPAPASPTAPTTATAQAQQLRDLARASGYDVSKFDSDETLARAMFDTIKRLQTESRQYQARLAAPSKAPEPPAPITTPAPAPAQAAEPEWDLDKHFSDQWGAPQVDSNLLTKLERYIKAGVVIRDERTGEMRPAEGDEMIAGPLLAEISDAYEARTAKAREYISGNPLAATWKAFQEPLQRMIQEQLGTYMGAQRTLDNYDRENAGWLYTTDPTTGRRAWSEKGQAWQQAVAYFQERGIADPDLLLELATLKAQAAQPAPLTPFPGAPPAQPAAAAPPTPEQVSAQKQETFLEQAARKSGHSPQSSGYVGSEAGPNLLDEMELDNFFVNRHKQLAAAGAV